MLVVEQALVGVVEQPVGPTAARISRGNIGLYSYLLELFRQDQFLGNVIGLLNGDFISARNACHTVGFQHLGYLVEYNDNWPKHQWCTVFVVEYMLDLNTSFLSLRLVHL